MRTLSHSVYVIDYVQSWHMQNKGSRRICHAFFYVEEGNNMPSTSFPVTCHGVIVHSSPFFFFRTNKAQHVPSDWRSPGKGTATNTDVAGVTPQGPLFQRLKNGESVRLDNGAEVHPGDVSEPPTPGRKCVILVRRPLCWCPLLTCSWQQQEN